MTKMKWPIGAAFLVFLALLYVVSYALLSRPAEPQVQEIYFADRMTEAHQMLIAKYNALHAGKIRVVPIDFPNQDFSTNERKEILARSLRGEGDGIDLLAVDIIWVQRFARWCEPLEGYFSPDELRRFIPDALSSCYSDSILVAAPLDMVQGVLYYREDLLRQRKDGDKLIARLRNGMTWEELLTMRQQTNDRHPFYIFPAAEFEGFICCYNDILLGLKPDYYATYGFRFDTPEARQALQFLVDLIHKYGATPESVSNYTEVPSYEHYIRDDGLFLRGWTSYNKDFEGYPYDARKEQYLRRAPLPHFLKGRTASTFGGWDLMISKFSTKKAAVVDFVKFILSDEAQEILYANGGYYPVVTTFYEDPSTLRKYPEIRELKSLMQSGVHRPAHKDYTNYSKIMAHYFVEAVRGKISVKEATLRTTHAIQSEQSHIAGW